MQDPAGRQSSDGMHFKDVCYRLMQDCIVWCTKDAGYADRSQGGPTWSVHGPEDVQFLKSGEVYSAAVPRQDSMVPMAVCQSPSCKWH